MKIALVGFDTEGRASYEYFSALGHEITICDQNSEITVPEEVDFVLGRDYLEGLDRFDLIVRTAGLHPNKILEQNSGVEAKITTHVNEFFKACPTKNIIGVTGTKGKGTTSTLIAKMLASAGKNVQLGGNIGLPPLSFLDELNEDSWVVLELSSFQLIDLKYSPHIAVCLMVESEHLDWHSDIGEYLAAKQQLFKWQRNGDKAIYYALNPNSQTVVSPGDADKIPYYAAPGALVESNKVVIDNVEVCSTDDIHLLGEHNLQNVCAAVTAVWQVVQDPRPIRDAVTDFSGLPFRLEKIRELHGVTYFNDSFGTTPETSIVAIKAFDQPKIIILGGSDKGADFNELARTIAGLDVRAAILIGKTAPKIAAALNQAGFKNIITSPMSMKGAVLECQKQASDGDVVLLSTACASFDMFKNYKDRGEQFNQAVRELV